MSVVVLEHKPGGTGSDVCAAGSYLCSSASVIMVKPGNCESSQEAKEPYVHQ